MSEAQGLIAKVTIGDIEVHIYKDDDVYSFASFILTNSFQEDSFNPKGFDGHNVPNSFKELVEHRIQRVIAESLKKPMRFRKVIR